MNDFEKVLECFEEYDLVKIATAYADGYNCFNEDDFLFKMDKILEFLELKKS